MKHLDLFSGIGGFALACRWAGIETIGFCEIDKFCQKVLNKNFPGIPIAEDINDVEKIREIVADSNNKRQQQPEGFNEELRGRTIDRNQQATPDTESSKCKSPRNTRARRTGFTDRDSLILTAGFPCQPFSNAGRKGGAGDDRYLWPQTLAVIESVKPDWIILENVAGLLNMVFPDNGVTLDSQASLFGADTLGAGDLGSGRRRRQYHTIIGTIVGDLRKAGYEPNLLVIPACAVGAPHRRDRIWIVGYTFGSGQSGEPRRRTGQESTDRLVELESRLIANPNNSTTSRQRENGGGIYGISEPEGLNHSDRSIPGWRENWYEVATRFCRVDARIPDRVDRLKALGNAIVPQVAYQIIKAIKELP